MVFTGRVRDGFEQPSFEDKRSKRKVKKVLRAR
jgi:hypothetical protein